MSRHLVIVESPAKARALKRFLGKDYEVMASYGHVRDLLPKDGAVDTEHDFAMQYELIEKNAKHVTLISKTLSKVDDLYLATDPDREGEAIAWHLYELIKNKRAMKNKPVHRVVFHEITKSAILDAMQRPRELSFHLIDAYKARRALDFLVGFNLSPLLWKKIRWGLSAGRVQSPALRMIVERELEIEKFESKEYWTIEAEGMAYEQKFNAKLIQYQGEKIQQFSVVAEKHAFEVRDALIKAAKGELLVTKVEKKQRKRNPTAPFITSTLQQEAARKLGFGAQRTMRVAQQLYEGIDIEGETQGLITYMRTDSVHLADDAVEDLRELIKNRYGADNLPKEPRKFKTSAKNAQEAHEAIRPTNAHRTPESLKAGLSPEQFKLYDLIWKRTVASQMIHATINTLSVDLTCGLDDIFRATGSVIAVSGFITVYQEGKDDTKSNDDDPSMLPPFKEGDKAKLLNLDGHQHFTEPPPRFSEASLIKALEEHGIGRPSTYASIISTLVNREYVELETKRFYPTDVGRVVNRFLTEYFENYVDYMFTARLEDELDAVARGEKEWVPLLSDFWKPFNERVQDVLVNVKRSDVTQEKMDEKCPKCGKPLSIRLGRRGRFVGCSGFPDCDYTRNIDGEETTTAEVIPDRKCPQCDSDLLIKAGRYGKFIGCSAYPKCKFIEPLEKPEDTEVRCPECSKGNMLKRRSKRGKIFYSCSRYPDCAYAIWNEPLNEVCPECGWLLLTIKTTKRSGTQKVCPQKNCNFIETYEPPTEKSAD